MRGTLSGAEPRRAVLYSRVTLSAAPSASPAMMTPARAEVEPEFYLDPVRPGRSTERSIIFAVDAATRLMAS